MIRFAALAAFAALIVQTASADPAPPALSGCTLNEVASLDITLDPGGAAAVPIMIDNRPVRFAVDTGALLSVVTDSVANQLQLDRKSLPLELVLAGGVKTRDEAVASTFTIGHMTARDLPLAVMPASALTDFETDGLLGPDIISNYDVEFDFAHAKFNMFSQDHCEGNVVYWAHGGAFAKIPLTFMDQFHIAAQVVLDGKPILAIIDTGAQHSLMPLATAQQLGFDVSASNVTHVDRSINGTPARTLYRYPFGALSLEGVTVTHPDIDVVPGINLGRGQLLLGMETLRQLHLYIAYKERALYVTPAETP